MDNTLPAQESNRAFAAKASKYQAVNNRPLRVSLGIVEQGISAAV
jgi:hypothetical protein